MNRNRQERRALKAKASTEAAKLAGCCFDYRGTAMQPVADPVAIATLTRAFTLMLQAGGQPMAIPITDAETLAFPRFEGEHRLIAGGVTWLAVGLDVSSRATYSMQSAWDESRALAHEAARALALSRLGAVLNMPGFPAWQKEHTDV